MSEIDAVVLKILKLIVMIMKCLPRQLSVIAMVIIFTVFFHC